MAQIVTILLAAALMLGGAWLRPPSQSLPTQGRHLVRPLVLPFLWRGLQDTQRWGSIDEYVAKGRNLMRFVPEWRTGHVHLANQLAYEGVREAVDPEAAVDRLAAGIQLLEAAMKRHPEGTETYLKAIVAFLYVQNRNHPAVADAFARRLGNPLKLAESYWRRIPRLDQSAFLQDEIPFLIIEGIPHTILLARPNWRTASRRDIRTAIALLAKIRNRKLAAQWHQSLTNLDSYLARSDDISLADLAKDPRLRKIVEAIR